MAKQNYHVKKTKEKEKLAVKELTVSNERECRTFDSEIGTIIGEEAVIEQESTAQRCQNLYFFL